jgi:aminoglycoside 3'-phosphotransferase-2
MNLPSGLPEAFAALRGNAWTPVTIGRSDAEVWRITLADGNAVFLKAERIHALGELAGEIERLEWLTRMGFKAPRVIDTAEVEDRGFLLMTAVPGADLTHGIDQPEALCRIYAQGFRRLHALDPAACPFDHGIDARLAEAEARVAAGLVDETDFDATRHGWTARQVFDWLVASRPEPGERIVTHGDASAPNILAQNGRFSGMVDCGRLGVADLWQDLALACRSIAYNVGEQHIAGFLAAYGVAWDETKYRYYCALDELF